MFFAVTFDSLPLPLALPIPISCLFSKPDWLWLMFCTLTLDLPPADALPMSISCLFNRPDWLWLTLSAVTVEVEPLWALATPANARAIATATSFNFMISPSVRKKTFSCKRHHARIVSIAQFLTLQDRHGPTPASMPVSWLANYSTNVAV